VAGVKILSRSGGLRGDLRLVAEHDNAGIYETLLQTPTLNVSRFYTTIDLTTSTQSFAREITPQLIEALTTPTHGHGHCQRQT